MRNDLVLNWNVGGRYKNLPYPVVLYDKADTARFKVFGVRERHELLQRLGLKWGDQMSNETIATYEKGGKYYLREDRPVMLISATSWTKDEVPDQFYPGFRFASGCYGGLRDLCGDR
jgi:hypothetical protein